MKTYSIAIDGPAGSGKSTIAKIVAQELNFVHINSGLFYRTIAIYLIEKNIDYNNESLITEKLLNKINLTWTEDNQLLLDNKSVDRIAVKQKYASVASIIAQYPIVREFINNIINKLSEKLNIVVDGRDIGTLVLPNATAKIFLDADVTTRAIRRLRQDSSAGTNINTVINNIIQRDSQDYSRPIAPLAQAGDALLIDCSSLDIKRTVEKVKMHFMKKVTHAEWKD